ncbi:MAG: Ig-like domain-containing protein [Candidatus Hermodarchaeia archaeon]
MNLKYLGENSVSGEIFSTNIRVDDLEPSASFQVGPSIAIDNRGTAHIVWEDWRNDADGMYVSSGGVDGLNNADIYYTNSTDGGITFSPNKKVNANSDLSQQGTPSVAVDSKGVIHVVWTDYRNDADIYYANSSDGGTTWSQGKRVNDDVAFAFQGSSFRSIAVDGNDNLHVVWLDVRNNPLGDIYYANSTDGGITFGENKKVNDISNGSWDASIAIDGNDIICIVWADNRDDITKSDIYFAKSMDGGVSFSANKKVNDDNLPSVEQRTPYVAVGNGIIGVAWADRRNSGYESIYFANSTDGGESFNDNKRVDDDSTSPFKARPVLAIDGSNNIYVTWHDKRNGEYDIYFANSTDGGNSFSENQQVNDFESINKRQGFPSTAVNNFGTVYIVWTDYRNGNRDIYLSRSNRFPPNAIPISPPKDSTLIINKPKLIVTSAIDLDNDTICYNFTIADQPDAESGTSYSSGWIDITSWTTPELPDGKWYWHTYTSDLWNTTAPNWVWNFTIDTTPPVISNLKPPDQSWTNDSMPTISADCKDESGINVSSVMFEIDGSDMTSSAIVTLNGITYTPLIELSDGLHTIILKVEDSHGNRANVTWSFLVDSTPPTITDFNASSVILKVDGEDVTSLALVSANGIEYVPPSALSEGSHTVYLELRDICGNMANVTWTFKVDTQQNGHQDDFLSEYWWILVVIAVVIIFLIILFFAWRRRRKSDEEDDSES